MSARFIPPLGRHPVERAVREADLVLGDARPVAVPREDTGRPFEVVACVGGVLRHESAGLGYYDIALRDVGLLIGALALARLASSPSVRRPAGARAG